MACSGPCPQVTGQPTARAAEKTRNNPAAPGPRTNKGFQAGDEHAAVTGPSALAFRPRSVTTRMSSPNPYPLRMLRSPLTAFQAGGEALARTTGAGPGTAVHCASAPSPHRRFGVRWMALAATLTATHAPTLRR